MAFYSRQDCKFKVKFQSVADRKGTFKVEYLQNIERQVQEKWEREKVVLLKANKKPVVTFLFSL